MTTSRRPPRFWFYKPELYWYGWRTLAPVWRGGDEFNRRTLVIGWNFFGQLVVPYRYDAPSDALGSPFYGRK